MLARRFTIVCLLTTIFGMGLAVLVAQAGRPARTLDIGAAAPCIFDEGYRCAAPRRR